MCNAKLLGTSLLISLLVVWQSFGIDVPPQDTDECNPGQGLLCGLTWDAGDSPDAIADCTKTILRGELYGSPVFEANVAGNGMWHLPGGNDMVRMKSTSSTFGDYANHDWSMEFWFFTAARTTGDMLAGLSTASTGARFYLYDAADTNLIQFYYGTGSKYVYLQVAHGTQLDKWYHIVGTFSNGTIRAYINGAVLGSNSGAAAVDYTGTRWVIGGGNIEGYMSETYRWQRQLTDAEIKDRYNKGRKAHP